MKDVFLLLIAWSVAPILLPIRTPEWLQCVLFYGWAAGQVGLVLFCVAYLARATISAPRALKLQVGMYLALALLGASAHVAVQWDAQATYDRVARLTIQYRGLWNGLVHGGNSWILGYPPGTALAAVWGHVVGLSSCNIANVILLTMFFWTWTLRYVPFTGLARSGFVFAILFFYTSAPIGWANPAWHYVVYYNNLTFALLWMLFVFVELRQVPWSLPERSGYALVLVWLRPVLSIACLPVLSAAAIHVLLRREWRRPCATALLALAIQALGVWMWNAKMHGLERMQAAHAEQIEAAVMSHKDDRVLKIDIATNPQEIQPTEKASIATFKTAVQWAAIVAWIACGGALAMMLVCVVLAVPVGWRHALAYLIPPLNVVGLAVGTGFFALHYPTYTDNREAFERLLIICPILMAAVIIALDADLAEKRRRLEADT